MKHTGYYGKFQIHDVLSDVPKDAVIISGQNIYNIQDLTGEEDEGYVTNGVQSNTGND